MSSPKEITVTLTNQTIVRAIIIIVITLLGINFIDNLTRPLTLIFVSFFLALALNPAVSWITHRLKSKSRTRATGVAYLAVLSLLVSFLALIVPPLIDQSAKFINDLPDTVSGLQTQDSATGRFVRKYDLNNQIQKFGNDLGGQLSNVRKPLLSSASRVGGSIISVITVLVLTFMMLVEGPSWLEKIWALQPDSKRAHRKLLAQKMYKVVTGYVNGQLLIAVIAGSFALVALLIASTVFSAPVNAVALAGIITLTGLIPMIGNVLGSLVVVSVCLFSSTGLAITMGVFFLVYQQIENVTIQPHIHSKTNNLTPLLVFVAALLGIGFGGILGGLVAIPVAGCLKIVLEDYVSRHHLN